MRKSDFNKFMMKMAYTVASNSEDPDRQVGAVITKDEHIIAYGWNGTPSNYYTNICKESDGTTKREVVHAEINAIAKAASSTISTKGATIYSTTIPCIECAKAIIQSGIRTVFYTEDYNKCILGMKLLKDCHVNLIKLED